MENFANVTLGQLTGGLVSFAVLLSAFIEIAPIKINPISKMLAWVGVKINGEVITKVDKLETEVKAIQQADAERDAINCRARILRFGDEVIHGVRHSKDHFDQTLRDIDTYEKYCSSHPDFKNNVTGMTTAKIKDVYKKRLDQNDFL